MAVNRTIRCKLGVNKFLPADNCDEIVVAFKYENKKVEAHSLKRDCTPLYLEEDTTVRLLSHDTFGTILLAVTPYYSTNCLDFRVWDVGAALGFVPKDIHLKVEHKKEGKFHCMYDVQKVMNEDLKNHVATTLGSLLCLVLNGRLCILMNAQKNDLGVISFDIKLLQDMPSPVIDLLFLKELQNTYLLLAENSNFRVMLVDNEQLTTSAIICLPNKKSKATTLSHFLKITYSKCFVVDNSGYLSLFSLPNNISPLKFPSSVGGHSVCAVGGFRHTAEGILAVCNSDYTINLYSLTDIITSVNNGVVSFVKPYRILCSHFPINSLLFVRHDQLAMASSINQSITFWGGLSQNIN